MRVITDQLRFPEGPVALPDGSFLTVEIEGQSLAHIAADGTVSRVAKLGGGPNGAAIGPDGHCYVCNNGGFNWHRDNLGQRPAGQADDYSGGRIERVNLATGSFEVLYDSANGHRLRSPNDIVFDRTGGFWFTDRGKTRRRDMDLGGICYARPDGSMIREVIFPFLTPNGIALSPAEDVLYVAETSGVRVWAFDIIAPGEVARRPWPSPNGGRLVASLATFRPFDSMAVDGDGNICVATLMQGGIAVFSPSGDLIDDIPMPDHFVTNLCFGGPGLRRAYVTLSQSGRLAEIDWPRPGLALNFADSFQGKVFSLSV